ncbi:MAG TPA: RNB domain-containing ribonuclease, partial [Casimicrobiaceae bacterium]
MTPDLRELARQVMLDDGFDPDFTAAARADLRNVGKHPDNGAPLRDLRGLLWSSIDNDDTRDLDQVEYAEQLEDGGYQLWIGVADVDAEVPKGSAIDAHAAAQTTTVYTGAVIFPMLPLELSAGATSLFEDVERKAVVVEMSIGSNGELKSSDVYR